MRARLRAVAAAVLLLMPAMARARQQSPRRHPRLSIAHAQHDFGTLASNLFGLDGGALIGLEYPFGVMRGPRRFLGASTSRSV
jgi:hypothetical protein